MKKFFKYIPFTLFALAIVLLCFFVVSAVLFLISYAGHRGHGVGSFLLIGDYIFHPTLLIDSYKDWLLDFRSSPVSFYLVLPLFSPFITAVLVFCIALYVWSRRIGQMFATAEQIRTMGLNDGAWMCWGKTAGSKIQVDTVFTALALGRKGSGKTLSLSIPSVLESDVGNIAVLDETGLVAKATSGYRAKIGTVFYFDFDQIDPNARLTLARWNPLSTSNIPHRGLAREEYIKILTQNLVLRENDYWGKLLNMAVEGLLGCFIDKIEQAMANDYFLDKILGGTPLDADDMDILISYYATMPKKIAIPAIQSVKNQDITIENYFPIGTWSMLPKDWQGKELSLAMCSDCLLQLYFYFVKGKEEDVDGWKLMLDHFIKEAKLFGYNSKYVQMLEYLFYLSRKQRKIIFTLIMNMLSVFRLDHIRQATAISDFSNGQLRGLKNIHGKLRPVTLYIKASSEEAKTIAKLMLGVVLEYNMHSSSKAPIAVVLDDFDKFGKIQFLNRVLKKGQEVNISSLLIAQDYTRLKDFYTAEDIEAIVSGCGYKIFVAKNSEELIGQLNFAAEYSAKSVQDQMASFKMQKSTSEAYYYLRIIKALRFFKKKLKLRKGKEMIMAEGYYSLPIKANQLFYLQDAGMKEKAEIEPKYEVDEIFVKLRNMQDVNPPSLHQVLDEVGMKVKSYKEINDFIKDEIEGVNQELANVVDKEAMLTDDVSSRWQKVKKIQENLPGDGDLDWWMEEDAFSHEAGAEVNPFK